MTELPPDIPPWSPLADRGRSAGGATGTATVPDTFEALTVVAPPPEAPEVAPADAVAAPTPTPPARRTRALWLAAGLLGGVVLALALAALVDDGEPAPTPTTVVRAPLPTTTFDEPAAVGTKVALGNGWTVVVRGVNPNATPAVAPLNKSAPPLEEGQRYVLIDVEASYVDGRLDDESPFYGIDLAVVGEDGRMTTPADSPCTAPPPGLDVSTSLTRGSSTRGRICFAVDSDQVATLRLVAEPSMTYGSESSWFSLDTRR